MVAWPTSKKYDREMLYDHNWTFSPKSYAADDLILNQHSLT
ncbi:hypothetical protein DSUL_260012 [Desulfovibrionales bacterium]